ncbi:MFS general substrate transporter [Coniochaeta hoffmannii]|uniref:MFS general substrate transporter n=1 Tax=Coniochaeta hoffmannii TaxID=91930 RepID=A0AA38RMZ7_9PEZI|nr:MFS general substrate transporter [Coniochaeta hoffmannii]
MAVDLEKSPSHEANVDAIEATDHNFSSDTEKAVAEEGDGKITFKTKMAVLALILMYESYLFTLLMPAAVLTYINADLGPDTRYPWITICNSWNLGASIIVTIGGRLSDIAGRRWFLLFGACAAAVGAVVGATGQSINQMIVSGIIFGVGGGFQEMCFACAQELVPNKDRFKTLGVMILANHFSSFSPIIGYVFIAYTKPGWRSCYWWCFAWEAVTAVMLFFFYHPPTFETKHEDDHKTKLQLIKEIDYVGLLLFTAGCLFILLALNWGGGLHPWKSSWVIAPLVVGFVCFIALGFWEAYMPLEYPILPPHLFVQWRKFTSFLVVCFVAGMLYYSMNVIWPRQSGLLWVPADKPIIRGVYANLISFGTIIAGWYCVGVMPWIKHERWQLIVFMILQTALIGSLASVGINDKAQAIATVILVATVNLPPSPLSFGIVSLNLDDQTDIGVAVGLISTFRLIGGAIATAIYTSIQSSRYAQVLPGWVESAARSSGFNGSESALLSAAKLNTAVAYNKVPGITNSTISAVQYAVKEANSEAYKIVYLVAIAFGAVAITAAFSTKGVDEKQRNSSTAAKLETEKGGDISFAH